MTMKMPFVTFAELGVNEALCGTIEELGWRKPTSIQCEALPHAFAGRDLIGLAETGSGKTAAFALPILQALMTTPRPYFGLILAPTRELALQIAQQMDALGKPHGACTVCLVGGVNLREQTAVLASRKHHVVVATPGRLAEHLAAPGKHKFHLKRIKFLVLDEADRILKLDDGALDKILAALPAERNTYLFSATMTKKVEQLQKASLKDPVLLEISSGVLTAEKLQQYFILVPQSTKDACLLYLVRSRFFGKAIIIFTPTWKDSTRLALLLRHFHVEALPLNGHMSQRKRLASLQKFRVGERTSCLLATDLASRGLDIPGVDVVINYSMPNATKDYVHRVGRTARAGRSGLALNLVTQYNVDRFKVIEEGLGLHLSAFPLDMQPVQALEAQVEEALRNIDRVMKEQQEMSDTAPSKETWKRRLREDDEDDSTLLTGMRTSRRKRTKKTKDSSATPKS